jgi:hypothetical protein
MHNEGHAHPVSLAVAAALGAAMKLGRALIDAVEAVLPGPEEAGIPARIAHDRVGRWGRTTVRHALAALASSGRAEFHGSDRHRLYRRTRMRPAAEGAGAPAADDDEPMEGEPSWSDYAARADGSVRRPDEAMVAALMRQRGIRYGDASAAELRREERLPGWSWPRPADGAALTRAVFGDPPPGRVLPP